jgi:hypothetical protein
MKTTSKLIATVLAGCALVTILCVRPPTAAADTYGKCHFDLDCHKNAKCNEGTCADAPGGKCHWNQDCPSNNCVDGKCK